MESSFVGNSKQILTVSYTADGISCHSLANRIHGFKIATKAYGEAKENFTFHSARTQKKVGKVQKDLYDNERR